MRPFSLLIIMPFLLLPFCEITEEIPGEVSTVKIDLYNHTEVDPYEGIQSMRVVIKLNGEDYLSSFSMYPLEEGNFTFSELKDGGVAEVFVYGYSDTSGNQISSFGRSPPFLLFNGLDAEIGVFFGRVNQFMKLQNGLNIPRYGHTAHLLEDGRVLIVGGFDSHGNPIQSTEFFDPSTGRFSFGPSMIYPRASHASTIYRDGEILISGGITSVDEEGDRSSTNTAEVFDPIYETFTQVNPMNEDRHGHLLIYFHEDYIYTIMGAESQEMYNIGNRSFREINDPIPEGNQIQNAAALSDEAILVLGRGGANTGIFFWWINEEDIEKPITSAFVTVSSMSHYRFSPALLPLSNGFVLICGGMDVSTYRVLNSCEIFSPTTREFSETTSMLRGRMGLKILAYDSDYVVITDGKDDAGSPLGYTEFYNTGTGVRQEFRQISARYQGTSTILPDHSLILIGGIGFSISPDAMGTAEVLIPYFD